MQRRTGSHFGFGGQRRRQGAAVAVTTALLTSGCGAILEPDPNLTHNTAGPRTLDALPDATNAPPTTNAIRPTLPTLPQKTPTVGPNPPVRPPLSVVPPPPPPPPLPVKPPNTYDAQLDAIQKSLEQMRPLPDRTFSTPSSPSSAPPSGTSPTTPTHNTSPSATVTAPAPSPTTSPPPTAPAPAPPTASPPATKPAPGLSAYQRMILDRKPVLLLSFSTPQNGTQRELTKGGGIGTYLGGMPERDTLPNGDPAVRFNGVNQYVSMPGRKEFAIAETGALSFEIWVQLDKTDFATEYVNYLGMCFEYAPSCMWEARFDSPRTKTGGSAKAYAFNPGAGYGSGARWQPRDGALKPNQWYHIVGIYQTKMTPARCNAKDPGSINIWVNGVKWNELGHGDTGCMSQYGIKPSAFSGTPLTIGTVARDSFLPGAVGNLALYPYELSPEQIKQSYVTMTGLQPKGACAPLCTLG